MFLFSVLAKRRETREVRRIRVLQHVLAADGDGLDRLVDARRTQGENKWSLAASTLAHQRDRTRQLLRVCGCAAFQRPLTAGGVRDVRDRLPAAMSDTVRGGVLATASAGPVVLAVGSLTEGWGRTVSAETKEPFWWAMLSPCRPGLLDCRRRGDGCRRLCPS